MTVGDAPFVVRTAAGAASVGSRGRPRLLTWRRLVAHAFAAAPLVLVVVDEPVRWLAPWGTAAGAALAVLGEALRVWACGHLRKNRDLVTSGPYAYVRNPLYLGTLLILVGVCLAAGDRIVVCGVLPAGLAGFALYYAPKKERIESRRLGKRFGPHYELYRAAVRGYLPRLTPWGGASRERWSAALVAQNSEVGTAVLVVLGLATIAAGRALIG